MPKPTLEIYKADIGGKKIKLPLFTVPVSAGFPSPAEDYIEQQLNLNEHLIDNPASTFCVRVTGNSMTGAGINNGDILIVDRSKQPKNNGIIIGVINGEFTVKRVRKNKEGLFLVPENPNYKALKIDDCMDFSIWGVVTYIIHKA
jgi:DNA polymerase V